jgi:magnesium transporter
MRERCEACPTVLSQGEDYIVYAILDFIVDNYMPVLERIRSEVEALEDTVLTTTLSQSGIERLYMLRRDLLRLRNAAGPLVEVCNRLEHSQLMLIDKEIQPHFRDVTDDVRRVREEIDALREVLAFVFEASLMAGQAQQTIIARRLAACGVHPA